MGSNLSDQDFKYLIKTAFKRLFASTKMQQWTMTAHYSEKFGTRSKMHKAAGKQYIYDFDKNDWYFHFKLKIESLGPGLSLQQDLSSVDMAKRPIHRFGLNKNYEIQYMTEPSVIQYIEHYLSNFTVDW